MRRIRQAPALFQKGSNNLYKSVQETKALQEITWSDLGLKGVKMPNMGSPWKQSEIDALLVAFYQKPPDVSRRQWAAGYATVCGRSNEAVDSMLKRQELQGNLNRGPIPQSPYPVYDEPLVMEGNAVILPDLEAPFHHAEFVNRVLDLAAAWDIRQAILPGDAIHLNTFSNWHPNWTKEQVGGVTEKAENKLVEFAQTLSKKKQGEMFELLGGIGKLDTEDGASTELTEAGKVLRRLADQFEAIDWDMGNHEGRALRTMETALSPSILLDLVAIPETQRPKWRVAPYYFSSLVSNGEIFQIEHPKNFAKYSAWKLCAKYGCSVIMTHSHHLNFSFDMSGKWYAIEAGCCGDESRLPYAVQRHNISPQHALGSVIVRDGVPWLLHARSPFDKLRMI